MNAGIPAIANEILRIRDRAWKDAEIELLDGDIHVAPNGDLSIDGMDPDEWLDAMTMD